MIIFLMSLIFKCLSLMSMISLLLTYSVEADRPDELCYNSSILNDLTQMVNFLLGSLTVTHNTAVLDLFISSYPNICSTTVFPPFGISDHVVVSVSVDFLSNSK